MDCLKIQELLYAYVDSALLPEINGQVRSHLRSCSVCAAEENCLQNLTANLKALPKMPVPKTLQRRTIKAFRNACRRKREEQGQCWHEAVFVPRWLTSCMAIVGFCIGLFLGGSMLSAADISVQKNLLVVAETEGIFYEELH